MADNEKRIHEKLIDTHCHLDMDAFDADREDVISRAKEAGLEAVITIGSDIKGNIGAVELSRRHDFIYSAVGIHPHDAKDFSGEVFERIKGWVEEGSAGINGGKIVAVGEIGLDYHYDHSPRDIQRRVFEKQLRFAREKDLPIVIHSREAKEDTLRIVREADSGKGVFHCFSGDTEMAKAVLELGYHISIAGPVTFKKATSLKQIVPLIPDERLLVETDAPYLTPEPFRGKRNEPAYLIHTARIVAGLRAVSVDDVARITTLNAKRLFGIGPLPSQGELAYKIRDSLYLNITNRCTNRCSFCVRFQSDFVKGHNLKLSHEPAAAEVKKAIGEPSAYKEIVFCGYGEPLLRLDLVKDVAAWIKERGGKVRVNTNGHGNMFHKRNILPELQGLIDRVSISLDAHDEETYNRICLPAVKDAFGGVIDFIREARKFIPEVTATVVTVSGVDIEKCRKIVDELGVNFRIRELDAVG